MRAVVRFVACGTAVCVGWLVAGPVAGAGETRRVSATVSLRLLPEQGGFAGKVDSTRKCRKNRKVSFFRSVFGSEFLPYYPDPVRTNDNGKYRSDAFYDRGAYKYRVKVKKVVRGNVVCKATKSKAVAADS